MATGGPTVTLSNGVKMPLVGLGTWQSKPEDVKRATIKAIEDGYRLIDTAAVYGNEESIGEAIHECIAAGKVTREELFITTKCWADNLSPKKSEEAIRASLKRLNLSYVDLYLAHVPVAFDKNTPDPTVKVEDIWTGFEQIYELKLSRSIGISNWSIEQVERVMTKAKTPIHNIQVECHLYWPQHELHEVCKKHNISFTSYASLGSPGRVNFTIPGIEINWASSPSDLEDEHVIQLAKAHGKTPAQILLRYLLERSIAVIPKSVTPARILENFKIFDFSLSTAEVNELESVKHKQRLFYQEFMIGHPEDPYKSERQ